MRSAGLALLVVCGLIAGCANGSDAPPGHATLDTGLGQTGAAGQRGGALAGPSGAGNVATTPTSRP